MEYISIVACGVSLLFALYFIWFLVKEKIVGAIIFLAISVVGTAVAIVFNQSGMLDCGPAYIFGGIALAVIGIYLLIGRKIKAGIAALVICVIFVFGVANLLGIGMSFGASNSYEDYSSSNEDNDSSDNDNDSDDDNDNDGFYGSDGEYHPYVPEFGDGVNSWLEENW